MFLLLYRSILFLFRGFIASKKHFLKENERFLLFNIKEKFFIFILLLRIAGLPPFLGFYIKIIILFILISFKRFIISYILIISSILIIFIYTRIFLNRLTFFDSFNKITFNYLNIMYSSLFFLIFIMGSIRFII